MTALKILQREFIVDFCFVCARERTICDCFKNRAQMDSEIFAKAVNAYAADNKKNLSNLSRYAKKIRVYKKVTDLMEVLLNG